VTTDKPCTTDGMLVFELATENVLRRGQLAQVQGIKLAVDADELQVEIEALRAEVEAAAKRQRVA
jgi:hypothetical protein